MHTPYVFDAVDPDDDVDVAWRQVHRFGGNDPVGRDLCKTYSFSRSLEPEANLR